MAVFEPVVDTEVSFNDWFLNLGGGGILSLLEDDPITAFCSNGETEVSSILPFAGWNFAVGRAIEFEKVFNWLF